MRHIKKFFYYALACIMLMMILAGVYSGSNTATNASIIPNMLLFAQEHSDTEHSTHGKTTPQVDSSAVLYYVMTVVLVIWLGLGLFLFRIDRNISRLEKKLTRMQE